jgi:hypothetical protein
MPPTRSLSTSIAEVRGGSLLILGDRSGFASDADDWAHVRSRIVELARQASRPLDVWLLGGEHATDSMFLVTLQDALSWLVPTIPPTIDVSSVADRRSTRPEVWPLRELIRRSRRNDTSHVKLVHSVAIPQSAEPQRAGMIHVAKSPK